LKSRAEKFKGFALAQREALRMHQKGALAFHNMVHAPKRCIQDGAPSKFYANWPPSKFCAKKSRVGFTLKVY
jgi:hypothetical protein